MEYLWLLLPLLSGGAMAATTSSADTAIPTNMGFEVGSMLECLLDPGCDSKSFSSAEGAVPTPHPTFVTTTIINGRPVTINVDGSAPTGYEVAINDGFNHTMKCHAGSESPVSLTCDTPVLSTHHHHRIGLVSHSSRTTDMILTILLGIMGILALIALISCCCLMSRGRRRAEESRSNSPADEVTQITKTTTQTTGGTLGRAAEEGRSLAPFAGAAAAGAAAENAGRGSNGVGSSETGVGQGTGAGQAIGQGGQAGARQVSGSGAGIGSTGGAPSASLDHTGSEVVDNGSMRGRRVLRTGTGGTQQVVA